MDKFKDDMDQNQNGPTRTLLLFFLVNVIESLVSLKFDK